MYHFPQPCCSNFHCLCRQTCSICSFHPPNIVIPKSPPPTLIANTPNMVHITKNDFDRLLQSSFRDGSEEGFTKGFADASEKLNASYEEEIKGALADIFEREQEWRHKEYDRVFELGRTSGIQDECKHQVPAPKLQIDVSIQVDLLPDDDIFFTPTAVDVPLPPLDSFERPTIATSEVGLQTSPPISSIPLPKLTPSLLLSPAPISSTLIPIATPVPSLSPKLSWADDSTSLPLVRAPRDFSALRSNNKPFSTLRHRNRRRYKMARCVSTPPACLPSSNTNIPIPLHRRPPSRRYPHLSPPLPHLNVPPPLLPALDWDRDPRLFELSHVLRSLGWSHSFSSRP